VASPQCTLSLNSYLYGPEFNPGCGWIFCVRIIVVHSLRLVSFTCWDSLIVYDCCRFRNFDRHCFDAGDWMILSLWKWLDLLSKIWAKLHIESCSVDAVQCFSCCCATVDYGSAEFDDLITKDHYGMVARSHALPFKPSTYCFGDHQKCPKSLLALTDFVSRYVDMAIN